MTISTMNIHSYLTFSGNCREAMTFYQECLGGDLMLQPIAGSPMAEKLPREMQECILHGTLTRDHFTLMGSDMVPDTGLLKGNAISLMLDCRSEEELVSCFQKLASGGVSNHPLERTFWGALFGDLTDKYGNHWLLHHQSEKHKP